MFSTDKDKYHPTIKERGIVQPWMKRFNIDLKFEDYPLVFEAEYKGNFKAARKLWEMFTKGESGYEKNQELSKRYWLALKENNRIHCRPEKSAISIADDALMSYHFKEEYEVCKSKLITALQYFTNECDPEKWDDDKFEELNKTLYQLFRDHDKIN